MKTTTTTTTVVALLGILPSIFQCEPAYYQFGYQVDTSDTGDYHGHMEQLDGTITTGEFKVRLPDGRLQVTSYQADDKGYRPRISYEIDPLYVVDVPIPPSTYFQPTRKPVRRPPPKSYDTPTQSYLPPSINYDPRKQRPHSASPSYALPSHPSDDYNSPAPLGDYNAPAHPTVNEAPQSQFKGQRPQYAPPPASIYTPPDIEYNTYAAPMINFTPRDAYLLPSRDFSVNYLNRRHDNAQLEEELKEEPIFSPGKHNHEYYLVPIRGESGSKPILALLVKKRPGR